MCLEMNVFGGSNEFYMMSGTFTEMPGMFRLIFKRR